jgi:hypothetical protein
MPIFEKKKTVFTDITIILDRSGSMNTVKAETIGGFNEFLREQQEEEGKANLTLIQFDHKYQVDYEGLDIREAKPLDDETYEPRGFTALLDAVGKAIVSAKERIKKYEDKPGAVLFVVITDGDENASREWKSKAIKNEIDLLEKEQNWNFIFMGADQDAWAQAEDYGFKAGKTMSYSNSGAGIESAYGAVTKSIRRMRTGQLESRALATESATFFDQSDYDAQSDLGISNNHTLAN